MNKLKLSILTLLFSIVSFAQVKGNKNVTIVETEINSFNTLELGDDFEVQLQEANKASVEIETDENLHDVIGFSVTDSILRFKLKDKIRSKKRLKIKIRYNKALKHITLNDNAEIEGNGNFENDRLTLQLNEGSKAKLNIRVDTLKLVNKNDKSFKLRTNSRMNIQSNFVDLEIYEKGRMDALITCDSMRLKMSDNSYADVEGDIKSLNAELSSSADFLGENLTITSCDVTTLENSDFTIEVVDDININASGGSEIYLYGNPKIILESFTNTAKLHKKEK